MDVFGYLNIAATSVFEDNPECSPPSSGAEYPAACQIAARQGMAACAGGWLAGCYMEHRQFFEDSFDRCMALPESIIHFAAAVRKKEGGLSHVARRKIQEWADRNPDWAVAGCVPGLTSHDLSKLAHCKLPRKPVGPADYDGEKNTARAIGVAGVHEMSVSRLFGVITKDRCKDLTLAAVDRIDQLLPTLPKPPGRGVVFYDTSTSINYRYNGHSRWIDLIALVVSGLGDTTVYPVHGEIGPALMVDGIADARLQIGKLQGNRYNPSLPFEALCGCDDSPDWVLIISDAEALPLGPDGVSLSGSYYKFKEKHPDCAVVFYDMYAGHSAFDSHLTGFGDQVFWRLESLVARQRGVYQTVP